MNESWLQILAIGAVSLGAFAVLLDLVVYRLHRRALRRHYSRFPMFAIRDELVRLVVCGEISEDSLAWQRMYRSVNSILDMHQRLDIVDVVQSLAGYHLALRQNPTLKAVSERIDRETEAEAARVPRFGKVLDEMDDAFVALVLERSWPLPTFRLRLVPWRLRWRLRMLLFSRLLFRSVTREISQQGGKQLPGWQQWNETRAEAA